MKRICLMVIKNLVMVPYLYLKLCYYAWNQKRIPDEKKLALFKEIIERANRAGNVTVHSYGTEHIPKDQSFMYVPNHQGLYDVLAILSGSPCFFSVVMKKELEHVFFLNKIFQIMGAYSMDREDVRQAMKVIINVSREVSAGKNFLIFPEGTRSRKQNTVGQFKAGSFKCAIKAKCPIVPVALINSFKPFDTNTISPVTVQVHFLPPLYYDDYKNMKTKEIADKVQKQIQQVILEHM